MANFGIDHIRVKMLGKKTGINSSKMSIEIKVYWMAPSKLKVQGFKMK